MKKPSSPVLPLLAALLAPLLCVQPARAERIFESKDPNEKNLVGALTPAGEKPRTRSIRVDSAEADKPASQAVDRDTKAGLLIGRSARATPGSST